MIYIWKVHEISLPIGLASSESSGESKHMRRPTRACAARIKKSIDVDEGSDQKLVP